MKKIDANTCEFTNVVHSSFTAELRDSLAKQGIPQEIFQAARKPVSEAHNRQETPMFAKNIERHALKRCAFATIQVRAFFPPSRICSAANRNSGSHWKLPAPPLQWAPASGKTASRNSSGITRTDPISKLKKRYWEEPHVAGYPLVLAIQDFHAPQAMAWSNSALVEYLYAIRQTERVNAAGKSEIVSEPVAECSRGDRPPIAAGFFLQPDNEQISAVIANPGGTLSKFNRMGFLAGFGDRDIKMVRGGYCYRKSPIAEKFAVEVHAPGYSETWCEGLSVYHNPRAVIMLPPEAFPCAAHHTSREGSILSSQPDFHPVGTTTHIIVPGDRRPGCTRGRVRNGFAQHRSASRPGSSR